MEERKQTINAARKAQGITPYSMSGAQQIVEEEEKDGLSEQSRAESRMVPQMMSRAAYS